MVIAAPQTLSNLLQKDLSFDPLIYGLTSDSRKIIPGYLFAVFSGHAHNGRTFIPEALKKGASAILSETPIPNCPVPVVLIQDVRRVFALACHRFWNQQPKTILTVTGTNGKTSVASFCRQIFTHIGRKSASLGTLGLEVGCKSHDGTRQEVEHLTPSGLTTPGSEDLARWAFELWERGITHFILEASSHGLDQRRLDGLSIMAAGFTNLTQDHLDYHESFQAYREAKLRLFQDLCPSGGIAVLNADATEYPHFAATAIQRGQTILSVGRAGQAIRLADAKPGGHGQELSLMWRGRGYRVFLPLIGEFQASNALVAAGLCIASGEKPESVFQALEHIQGARGRLQRIGSHPNGGEVYIDYAHTPDGIATVLSTLRPHTTGRLVIVFGAGGDRDTSKRSLMGASAQELADVVIITDDNPRSENPEAIRAMIRKTCPKALEIPDRRKAILRAIAELQPKDLLVIAGKGHEQGQIIAGETHPFDDWHEARLALMSLKGEVI